MKRFVIALVLVIAACSGCVGSADESTDTTLEITTPVPTTTSMPADGSDTTLAETTTTTVITGDAHFIIGTVLFGDAASIEVGNLGPDPGDLTGFWLAIHPYYLELPSTVLAPGKAVIVSLAEDADPDLVIPAAGLLPSLKSGSGEIGLYASGDFGDPEAMVDYVEWGSTGHTRSSVAVQAELWPAEETIATDDSAIGLTADDRSTPGPQGWTVTTSSQ